MTPQKGQHVQCLHRLGGTVEGTVEEWSEDQSILKSMDGRSLLIIPQTSEDIRLIKIIFLEPSMPEIQNSVKAKLEDAQQLTGDPEIDGSNLKQLRRLVIEQDKKIITEKIKEHRLGETKRYEDKYELPGFLPKPRTK